MELLVAPSGSPLAPGLLDASPAAAVAPAAAEEKQDDDDDEQDGQHGVGLSVGTGSLPRARAAQAWPRLASPATGSGTSRWQRGTRHDQRGMCAFGCPACRHLVTFESVERRQCGSSLGFEWDARAIDASTPGTARLSRDLTVGLGEG
jgi:zinc-ribbon domain